MRRGAATTAVAVAAMAALTASQASGFTDTAHQDTDTDVAGEPTPPPGTPIDGGSSYYTDLPPLVKPGKPAASANLPVVTGPAESGIPATVLEAYKRAETTLRETNPGCNLPWQLLAAIGKVESGQARGGAVDAEGTTVHPILGPQLNGNGFARITDTDGGAYDGDTTHDRAVGPMQFIPSTWAVWGKDGNGDGEKNPNNVYDAALAAGAYLCAGGRDLSVQAQLDSAILGYNHSQEYLRTVLSWFAYYKKGTHEVPDGSGVLPPDERDGGTSGGRGTQQDKDKDKGQQGGNDHGSTPTSPPASEPGGSGSNDPGKPTPTPPSTPAPVSDLVRVGPEEFTAIAGTEFAESPRARAQTATGKPVAGLLVRYEIRGETQARFANGTTRAVVATAADGTAVAPKLSAGETAGSFTVRATVVERPLSADFTATVTERPAPQPQADTLARSDDTALTTVAGTSFADPVPVRATYQGKAAAAVPITATMITSAADQPLENDKGPFFKDAAGQPVRTLGGLKTDADGQLTLPGIFADGQAGTFLLRLTTADGVTLTIELTVTEPAAG